MIDFNHDAFDIASDIADRWEAMGGEYYFDRCGFIMDLMAADGKNGNPELRLDRLLHQFNDGSFGHDCAGIQRHMNRKTGQLGGCFLPRCAA